MAHIELRDPFSTSGSPLSQGQHSTPSTGQAVGLQEDDASSDGRIPANEIETVTPASFDSIARQTLKEWRDLAAIMSIFEVGERLGDTYEIQRVLGQGGMGQVFEAYDHLLARSVAIKASWPHMDHDGLLDESRAMAALRTAAVPAVYGMGVHRSIPYCVMERLHGQTLAAYCVARFSHGLMPIFDVIEVLTSVASALASVHDAGLAHRDLKPSNIMLAPDDRTVLLDFGLFSTYGNLFERPGLCGSPRYMAPEAISESMRQGQEHLIDIYALGIIGYVLVTGEHPYPRAPARRTLWCHVHEDAPDVQTRRADVPAPLARLIHDMLAKDPNARPFSAHAVVAELGALRARLAI